MIVRGLATDKPEKGLIAKAILRELRVGIMIGTICGGLVALSLCLYKPSYLSFPAGSHYSGVSSDDF
ncbi:hypothetical protein [Paenibacillus larvae]|uniref:hypothetical protein n=1 Tax=Paenibacillus larvae TaxID=1464 RepID=UPI00098F0C34|nr:hypothetical protein B5S25_18235 [Paenibacillus larvae subsp. pulvifaciens]